MKLNMNMGPRYEFLEPLATVTRSSLRAFIGTIQSKTKRLVEDGIFDNQCSKAAMGDKIKDLHLYDFLYFISDNPIKEFGRNDGDADYQNIILIHIPQVLDPYSSIVTTRVNSKSDPVLDADFNIRAPKIAGNGFAGQVKDGIQNDRVASGVVATISGASFFSDFFYELGGSGIWSSEQTIKGAFAMLSDILLKWEDATEAAFSKIVEKYVSRVLMTSMVSLAKFQRINTLLDITSEARQYFVKVSRTTNTNSPDQPLSGSSWEREAPMGEAPEARSMYGLFNSLIYQLNNPFDSAYTVINNLYEFYTFTVEESTEYNNYWYQDRMIAGLPMSVMMILEAGMKKVYPRQMSEYSSYTQEADTIEAIGRYAFNTVSYYTAVIMYLRIMSSHLKNGGDFSTYMPGSRISKRYNSQVSAGLFRSREVVAETMRDIRSRNLDELDSMFYRIKSENNIEPVYKEMALRIGGAYKDSWGVPREDFKKILGNPERNTLSCNGPIASPCDSSSSSSAFQENQIIYDPLMLKVLLKDLMERMRNIVPYDLKGLAQNGASGSLAAKALAFRQSREFLSGYSMENLDDLVAYSFEADADLEIIESLGDRTENKLGTVDNPIVDEEACGKSTESLMRSIVHLADAKVNDFSAGEEVSFEDLAALSDGVIPDPVEQAPEAGTVEAVEEFAKRLQPSIDEGCAKLKAYFTPLATEFGGQIDEAGNPSFQNITDALKYGVERCHGKGGCFANILANVLCKCDRTLVLANDEKLQKYLVDAEEQVNAILPATIRVTIGYGYVRDMEASVEVRAAFVTSVESIA